MNFKNYIRNEYGRCDTPENTIRRIQEGLQKVGVDIEWVLSQQFSDSLFWTKLHSPSIGLISYGKGISPQLSKASALAEFVERLSEPGEWVSGLYLGLTLSGRIRNFEWVKGHLNQHQDEIDYPLRIEELLSNAYHLTNEDIKHIKNSSVGRYWVDGYSLIHKKNVKVPLKLIHLVSRCNGLAAGNTIEEAIMHASCEIFERYALINVIKPEKIVPTIDIDSINSPVIEKLVDLFNKNNIDITIKDISFNGLLPCISILFTNKNLPSNHVEHRILQPGASFNQEEALIRCFTERMLGRLNIHRPVINKTISNKIKNYEKLSTSIISFKDISFLNEGEVTYLPKKNRLKDIFEELEQIKNICKKIGTDCIIVNLTHPILKFPVVRVIMPGISDKLSYLMPAKEFLEKINKIMQSFF